MLPPAGACRRGKTGLQRQLGTSLTDTPEGTCSAPPGKQVVMLYECQAMDAPPLFELHEQRAPAGITCKPMLAALELPSWRHWTEEATCSHLVQCFERQAEVRTLSCGAR